MGRKKLEHKISKEIIIQSLIDMKYSQCASQLTLIKFLKEKFGYERTMAYELLKAADDIVVEVAKENANDIREKQLISLNEQLESAKGDGDKKLVLEITKEINKISYIYIEKIEHTIKSFEVKLPGIDE